MKKTLIYLTTIFILVSLSCTTKTDPKEPVRDYLKTVLNDPESLVIYGIKTIKDDGNTVIVEVDYGAKNILGGMIRKNDLFYIFNGVLAEPLEREVYEQMEQKNKDNNRISDSINVVFKKREDSIKILENNAKPLYLRKY